MTAGGRRKRCPKCGARVKSGRLEAHLRTVHRSKSTHSTRNRTGMVAAALAITAIILVVAAYFITRPTREESDAGNGVKETVHELGSDSEDFWTVYPSGHASEGKTVPFPPWVQDESASKVLLVLTHSEGCAPCVQQQGDIRAIMGDPAFQTISSDCEDCIFKRKKG